MNKNIPKLQPKPGMSKKEKKSEHKIKDHKGEDASPRELQRPKLFTMTLIFLTFSLS